MSFEFLALPILVICLVGGFIAVFFNAFGTWIILLGALLFAYQTHFAILAPNLFWILGALAIAGEIAEHLLSYFGIKKMGGGKRSVAGAFLGGTLGGFIGVFFLGVGVVLGGLLGVFLGAYLMEITRSGSHRKSFKVGIGGVLGVAGSLLAKIMIALTMIGIIVSRVFQP